jgi:hypothetical protein
LCVMSFFLLFFFLSLFCLQVFKLLQVFENISPYVLFYFSTFVGQRSFVLFKLNHVNLWFFLFHAITFCIFSSMFQCLSLLPLIEHP